MNTNPKFSKLIDLLFLIAGAVVYAAAYDVFLIEGQIFTGGLGGLATLFNVLWGIRPGLMIFAMNVPLLIGLILMYGIKASVKSLIAIATCSTFLDLAEAFNVFPRAFVNTQENKLLYGIFGGITLGVAIGLMFTRGFTTGGTDIIALLLKPKFKKLSTSKLILITDVVVIVLAAVVMRDWTVVLYSSITVFMSTSMIGIVTGGFDKGGLVYIFSQKYGEIADAISTKMVRGVTLLDGTGWYTKNPEKIILCVVKKSEIYQIKMLAKGIDPKSFIIMAESTETIGKGFKDTIGEHGFDEKQK
ncbi:MAG: YitT family protein [Clostridiales bacterium]|nr:YitT family protein [Clostridiales bacterium]